MSKRRVVRSIVLIAVCALVLVVGVASAGKGPAPRVEVPLTQPAQVSPTMEDIIEQAKLIGPTPERHPVPPVPGGPICPGTEGVQNIHVGLGAPPGYFAQGKAWGMSDAEARAHAAEEAAAQQEMQQQMLKTLVTLPPPPCP